MGTNARLRTQNHSTAPLVERGTNNGVRRRRAAPCRRLSRRAEVLRGCARESASDELRAERVALDRAPAETRRADLDVAYSGQKRRARHRAIAPERRIRLSGEYMIAASAVAGEERGTTRHTWSRALLRREQLLESAERSNV